eukprot:15439166-Alexandrium_andersonii.AAC.1
MRARAAAATCTSEYWSSRLRCCTIWSMVASPLFQVMRVCRRVRSAPRLSSGSGWPACPGASRRAGPPGSASGTPSGWCTAR